MPEVNRNTEQSEFDFQRKTVKLDIKWLLDTLIKISKLERGRLRSLTGEREIRKRIYEKNLLCFSWGQTAAQLKEMSMSKKRGVLLNCLNRKAKEVTMIQQIKTCLSSMYDSVIEPIEPILSSIIPTIVLIFLLGFVAFLLLLLWAGALDFLIEHGF